MKSRKKSIKNIGISGVYGAGKSTVWNTYIKNKNIENIISISIAQYNKSSSEETQETEDEIVKENRIERQIINQIVSQVQQKSIPLYFNKIKENKIILDTCFCMCFVFRVQLNQLNYKKTLYRYIAFKYWWSIYYRKEKNEQRYRKLIWISRGRVKRKFII
ncbi:YobI family P-loop NTPase [Mycoplasma yeatsii]|uniref:YobI family P-loop NTPase n=1 Tax=Mycoplasma yeatsii TaxID=51365 RepID=UPI00352303A3